jgi:magnesium-protoporphyrin O-methyltransferase
MLLDMIGSGNARHGSVLDIGGGIGVIGQELLRRGAGTAVLVDASRDYLDVARQLARESGTLERIEFVDGDFVRRAPGIDVADVVTLDRVVCCYPDAEALVRESAARARYVYGLVLPRDRSLFRIGVKVLSAWLRLRRSAYRPYAHANEYVDSLVAAAGLRLRSERTTFLWRVAVYER